MTNFQCAKNIILYFQNNYEIYTMNKHTDSIINATINMYKNDHI